MRLKFLSLLGGVLLVPALISAGLAPTAKANETVRERNLANLDGLVALARGSLSGDACQEVMQRFQDNTEGIMDNPELIDTYIYMINKSTDADCIAGTAMYLDGSIRFRKKIGSHRRKRIADALYRVLNNENVHEKWWRVQIGVIAPDLKRMGPLYRRVAYAWYLKDLRQLIKAPKVTDNNRDEALGCVWNLLDANKLPAETIKKAIKKFNLIEFSQSSAATMNDRASVDQKKKYIAKMTQLLEVIQKPSEERTSTAPLTTEQFLTWARASLSGEQCQEVLDQSEYIDIPTNDPIWTDLSIYVVKHSTDASCVNRYITLVPESPRLVKHMKTLTKQWTEIGEFLTSFLNHPHPDIRANNPGTPNSIIVEPWEVRFSAAKSLRYMGPPYQERAYLYFLKELRRLSKKPKPTDDDRDEAVTLIQQFYFDYPAGWQGLYRKATHKPPIALFRSVNKNLGLLTFWETQKLNSVSSNTLMESQSKKMLGEFKKLIQAEQ